MFKTGLKLKPNLMDFIYLWVDDIKEFIKDILIKYPDGMWTEDIHKLAEDLKLFI